MIYFVQQGKAGPIKIGYTGQDDVKQRMSTLQTASSETLHLLGIADGDQKKEKFLHQLFDLYKLRGEWFEPKPRVLMFIFQMILGDPDAVTTRSMNDSGLNEFLSKQEITLIKEALAQTRGNKTEAAKLLGITFRSLRHRVYKYKLESIR